MARPAVGRLVRRAARAMGRPVARSAQEGRRVPGAMILARAAAAYAGLVFAAGIVLGTLRTLVLAPALGPLGAVLAELPVILALAWLALGGVLRRWPVPARAAPRLALGALAFAMLIALEVA